MHPSSPGDVGQPLAADASLHLLADHLLRARADGAEPALVSVSEPNDDGFDLGLRPLDGAHPSDMLLGFVAPADWHAVGVTTDGWAYRIGERAVPEARRTRVHVVTLVSRSGERVHRVAAVDGTPLGGRGGDDPGDVTGEQVDLLLRVLDVPTPPPPCDASVFWAIEWLVRLVADAPRTWREVTERHPGIRLLRTGDAWPAEDFLDIAGTFSRVCSWARIRALAAEGAYPVPDLTPLEAGWLDDGAFARFVLTRVPPLDSVRASARATLDGRLARRLDNTLRSLGVPARAWPDVTDAA